MESPLSGQASVKVTERDAKRRGEAWRYPQMEGRGEESAVPFSPPPAMLRPACSERPVYPALGDLELLPDSMASPSYPLILFIHSTCIYQLPTMCRCCSRLWDKAVTKM